MNAEQYRALVKKLEAITEAPVAAFNQDAGIPADASAPVSSVAADPAVAPDSAPTTAQNFAPQVSGEQIPTIEASTFSQAYAQAAKQGLKKFKWCGVYAVKDKPKPQPPKPQPPKPQPATDTIPTTRTVQPQYDVKNDWKGRFQAGQGNLI